LTQRDLQPLGNADIVHNQTAGLAANHPVHAGDGLHQALALHGLVHIHRGHARRVEAGQPHIQTMPDEADRQAFWPASPGRGRSPCRSGCADATLSPDCG
jgi:hypothetical protein